MNKYLKTIIISILLIIALPMAKLSAQVSTWDGTWEPWTHGTGTEADPFLIENAQQLAYLAYRVNNGLDANGGHVSNHDLHYKLMVDIDLNGGDGNGVLFVQTWEGEMNGWSFVNVTGDASWTINSYQGNQIAFISGFYNGACHTEEDWCISPSFNLDNYNSIFLSFRTAMKYDGNHLEVLFSNEYDGQSEPTDFEWIDITDAFDFSTGNYEWVESGNIDLSNYFNGNNCHIGFRYTSNNEAASNWLVDDCLLTATAQVFQWTPIGYWNSSSDYQCFGGFFDGNNHTISGLYINNSVNRVGLFGNADGTTIKNLCINGYTITTAGQYAGGVVGVANNTVIINCNTIFTEGVSASSSAGGIVGFSEDVVTITNCHNIGTVSATTTSSHSYSGGILGHAGTATITNCHNTGTASATATNSYSSYSYSGGILGHANTAIVTQCYNTGIASATTTTYSYDSNTYSYSGGIIGQADTATITNCYNTGTISASLSVSNPSYIYSGGICSGGILGQTDMVTITNCYNIGTVSFLYYSDFGGEEGSGGGILGYKNNGTVINSYYLNTSAYNNNYGGQPMSVDAMQTQDFVDLLNNGCCAWEYDYNSTNSGYPVLTDVSFSAFTKPATNISATTATLNGSIIVENSNLIAKGFEYRIAGTSSFTTINVSGNSNSFSYNLIDLTPNTTYDYRAFVKVSNCDITSYGEIETFEVTWQNQDTIFIYDADMLHIVAEQCNSGNTFEGKYIKLMNDIVLPENAPNNMISIGSYPNHPFKGTFDGNEKLIYNLYIDQPNTPYQGFFGYTLNANLYNVGLVNITASGRNYTGGMVAYAENTHLRDCYVNGGTLFALSYCGGLIGYQEQGTNSIVSGCYNTCSVSGNHYVGGLIGFSNYSTVRNSYVAGPVSGQGNGIGAIIGGANEVLMYYCYFSMDMTGQTNAIGENNIGGGKDGGEGLTNAQMRDPQFVATLNQGLMTPVWMADYASHINNGFPIIKWQRPGNGVEENNVTKKYIFLYPNPANDFVTIRSDDPNISLNQVEVYDVTGRKVMSEILDGQSQELSVAKLLPGVYHVRVQTDKGYCTNLKFVVQ